MRLRGSPTYAQARQDGAPLLEVHGLTVVHEQRGHRRTLVSDVGLRVGHGETVGIVGESGSGKSMTALAVLGLLPRHVRAQGSIRFQGHELVGEHEHALRQVRGGGISLLLQDPSTMLNALRRCVTHVEEGIRGSYGRLKRGERRREALRRLAEVHIDSRGAMRYPFQVSGGMAQRVGLASALAGDPRLLIADEPTTALDVTTQREILRLLKTLQERREMSLVLITHDLSVAFEVCDRLYIMYAGSIVEHAPPGLLSQAPLHPYSHGLLLSEPPLGRRRPRLNVIPGSVPEPDEVAGECPFSARCGWRAEVCTSARPPLAEVKPGRDSACVRIREIHAELATNARRIEVEEPIEHAAQRPEALLDVRALVKTFTQRQGGAQVVLTGLDLAVGRAESVGLVGESGSGKTTLARCIVGLETPTEGEVEIEGIDISDYDRLEAAERIAARRTIQMVFQNPYASLNPARTIGSTLAEVARMAGEDSRAASTRVPALLDQVGLPARYAHRRPAALSGGERQRVAIARGLAVRPKLLVCDEPTSALDVSVQAQILNLLRELQERLSLAMLFITHDLAVVRQVSDHLYVISEGRFVERGPTAEVLDHPQHEYTRLLLASVPTGSGSGLCPGSNSDSEVRSDPIGRSTWARG